MLNDLTPILSITVSTSGAYSPGDCVGGLLNNVVLVKPQSINSSIAERLELSLKYVTIIDADAQNKELNLFIFNEQPIGIYPNHGQFQLSSVDATKLITNINFAAADFSTVGSYGLATQTFNNLPLYTIKIEDSRTNSDINIPLYFLLCCAGRPRWNGPSNLTIRIGYNILHI